MDQRFTIEFFITKTVAEIIAHTELLNVNNSLARDSGKRIMNNNTFSLRNVYRVAHSPKGHRFRPLANMVGNLAHCIHSQYLLLPLWEYLLNRMFNYCGILRLQTNCSLTVNIYCSKPLQISETIGYDLNRNGTTF